MEAQWVSRQTTRQSTNDTKRRIVCIRNWNGSSTDVLLTRDNNYFNNVYITVALSPGGIISGWYSVVLTALYH